MAWTLDYPHASATLLNGRFSLVLTDEGQLAAWSSDGRLCGPRYFAGDRANAEASEVFAHLKQFVAGLR